MKSIRKIFNSPANKNTPRTNKRKYFIFSSIFPSSFWTTKKLFLFENISVNRQNCFVTVAVHGAFRSTNAETMELMTVRAPLVVIYHTKYVYSKWPILIGPTNARHFSANDNRRTIKCGIFSSTQSDRISHFLLDVARNLNLIQCVCQWE